MESYEGVRDFPWSLVDGKILDAQGGLVLDTFAIDVSAEEARLLAVAPELLCACRFAVDILTPLETKRNTKALGALSSAIAKVEGR